MKPVALGGAGSGLPIIFAHYGASSYLQYTLSAARLSNPGSRVILLGDASNKAIAAAANVEFFSFSDYSGSEIENQFADCYQRVEGAEHCGQRNGRDWVQFVFLRWFFIHAFCRSNQISSFWHFDSDTMVVADLGRFVSHFSAFECTELCGSGCLSGYVSNIGFLEGFLNHVIRLFRDANFIAKERAGLVGEAAGYAFTEMRAYTNFRDHAGFGSLWLGKPFTGWVFDDCLCQDHSSQMQKSRVAGREIKRVALRAGGFMGSYSTESRLVQFATLNMSWLPEIFYEVVYRHLLDVQEQRRSWWLRLAGTLRNAVELATLKRGIQRRFGLASGGEGPRAT